MDRSNSNDPPNRLQFDEGSIAMRITSYLYVYSITSYLYTLYMITVMLRLLWINYTVLETALQLPFAL